MPKHIELIVRGILQENSHILLCRNIAKGYYYLPGGHIEFGESAAAALAREFLEETGLTVHVGPFALAAEVTYARALKTIHELNLVFHVEQFRTSTPQVPSTTFHVEQISISSREPDIDFSWIRNDSLLSIDFRPGAVRDWILTPPAKRPNFISAVGATEGHA